jgi:MFS family permease
LKQINKWFALCIILVAPLLTIIDVYIINMAIKAIKDQYQTTDSHTELVISAYLVGYCVLLVIGGRLGDFFGRKRIFIWGMIAFTLTSAFCGWSQTIYQLILCRFFQGLSAAVMIPQTIAMIQITFTENVERNRAFGIFGIVMGIASIIGQFLGGYFVGQNLIRESWRLIFLINLPLGIVTVILARLFLTETKLNKQGKFDMLGVGLLTIALGSLIYSLTALPEQGLSLLISILLGISSLFFFIFWKNQKRKTELDLNPLLNIKLFEIRSFNFVLLIVLFYFSAHMSFLLVCSVQFQQILQIDPYTASQYFTFNGIGFLTSSVLALRLLPKYGVNLLIVGCCTMIVSQLIQVVYLNKNTVGYIPFFLLLYGLGQGIVLPSILNYALKKIPSVYAALAGGVYYTVQQFSSAFGLSIIGTIYFFSNKIGFNGFLSGMMSIIFCLTCVVFLLIRLSKFKDVNGLS